MAVKETPANFRVYYKSMKSAYTQMREDAISAKDNLTEIVSDLWKSIHENINVYKDSFDVNILEYEEYQSNKYISGKFLKIAKGLFINRKNDYTIVSDLFDLYNLARKQKEIYDIEKDIEFYDKLLSLKLKEYTEILKTFYNEVHKHMIIKGEGYVFEGDLGWTCINRCHIEKQRPRIDYAATKKKKAELEAQGKRLYNKEEAEWCKKNGLEYDAVDGRVYLTNEYCYEIPLINCKLPNGRKYKLEIADYRGKSVRGMSNADIAAESKENLEYICELPIDIKTKLSICNSIDKMLYINFIRNENQKPINATQASRKNRQ